MSRQIPIRVLVSRLNESIEDKVSAQEFHDILLPSAVETILITKQIKAKIHPDFAPALGTCIETIWSYRRLCATIEEIRRTAYDSDNDDHERKLLKLWNLLMPTQPLETRISKQWQDIGFQGDNPMSDFRGIEKSK